MLRVFVLRGLLSPLKWMQMVDTEAWSRAAVEPWLWEHGEKMQGLLLIKGWDTALGRHSKS